MRRSAAASPAASPPASETNCPDAASSVPSATGYRRHSSAGSAARNLWVDRGPGRTPAPCGRAPRDRTVLNRWDRRWAAGPLPSAAEKCDGFLVGRQDEFGIDAEPGGGGLGEAFGGGDVGGARSLDPRDQVRIFPDRHAVLAPVQAERPARQAFAGIPFAPWPKCSKPARRAKRVRSRRIEIVAETALGGVDRGDVPFGSFEIVDRHEGRLATHGEADVVGHEVGVDLLAERIEPRPGFIGKRLAIRGASRIRLTFISKPELDIGGADAAGDRRGRACNAAWRPLERGLPRSALCPEVTFRRPIQPAPGR